MRCDMSATTAPPGAGRATPADLGPLIDRAGARYLADLRTLVAERGGRRPATAARDGVPDRPALAPQVQLSGELPESGFADRQWLVQRAGRFIQLTELLYRVLEQVDGQRTLAEIAAAVSAATGRRVGADHIRRLLAAKLIPAGLVAPAAGAADTAARGAAPARSPLAVNLRLRLIGPRLLDPLTRVLQLLYTPPILVALLVAVAIGHGWLYAVHGLDDDLQRAVAAPGRLLLALGLIVIANAFHELGHAAALRYGGGQVRGIGAGLYLLYPVFYTDVTDSYRLGRWARVRTDLGGFYFHLLFALGLIALYVATGWEILLLVVVLLNLEILHQSLPFVRLDGYWALADLTGIPDFFSQAGPFLRTILPVPWWHGPRLPRLKGWVRLAFAAYLLVTVPLLGFLATLLVRNTPGLVTGLWDTGTQQFAALAAAWHARDTVGLATAVLQLGFVTLTATALAGLLTTLGRAAARLLRGSGRALARRVFQAQG